MARIIRKNLLHKYAPIIKSQIFPVLLVILGSVVCGSTVQCALNTGKGAESSQWKAVVKTTSQATSLLCPPLQTTGVTLAPLSLSCFVIRASAIEQDRSVWEIGLEVHLPPGTSWVRTSLSPCTDAEMKFFVFLALVAFVAADKDDDDHKAVALTETGFKVSVKSDIWHRYFFVMEFYVSLQLMPLSNEKYLWQLPANWKITKYWTVMKKMSNLKTKRAEF